MSLGLFYCIFSQLIFLASLCFEKAKSCSTEKRLIPSTISFKDCFFPRQKKRSWPAFLFSYSSRHFLDCSELNPCRAEYGSTNLSPESTRLKSSTESTPRSGA